MKETNKSFVIEDAAISKTTRIEITLAYINRHIDDLMYCIKEGNFEAAKNHAESAKELVIKVLLEIE